MCQKTSLAIGNVAVLIVAVLGGVRKWRKGISKRKRRASLALGLGIGETDLDGVRAVQEALTSRDSRLGTMISHEIERTRRDSSASIAEEVAQATREAIRHALPEAAALPAPSMVAALSAAMSPEGRQELRRASLSLGAHRC